MESAIGEDIAKAKGVDLVVVNPVLVLGPLLQPTINASIIHVLKYLTGSAKIYANSVQAYVHKSVVTDPGDDDTVNPRPGTLRHAVIQNEPLWIVFKRDIMNTTTQDSDTTTSTTASAAASSEAALEEAPPQPPPPPAAAAASAKAEPLMFSKDPNALESGGGISFLTGSRNARFSYGFSSFKGKRPSMEDYFEANISDVDGQMVAFFGVFDGHGGSRTAEYLKKNLFKNLSSHPNFIKDTKAAIVEVFKQTDVDYLNEEKGYQRDAGSTASTALLLGDRLFVANVGDSRVVGCRAGSAIPLSIDHKPDRSDERQRIEEAGGFIIWAGTWRVGGVLAVSRAFGDKVLKPFVVAEPEIQEEEIEGVDFIIIASDGLWNVISNKDAVALVQDIADAEEASRKLIQEAFARGSSDNITCVVVQFGISE